jgi:hypothetical protein
MVRRIALPGYGFAAKSVDRDSGGGEAVTYDRRHLRVYCAEKSIP